MDSMHWIIAFIRPTAVLTVRKNLENIGILGGTLSEVEGFGRQRGHTEIYRGHEYEVLTSPKVRLEVACSKGELNQAIEAICDGGRSGAGTIGDGKIFVLSLEEAVRIRTGDAGLKAL